MTEAARELGMTESTFRNSTGWPDPNHLMTARELAILAKHTIQDHPEHYHYYSEKEFTWNGIRQGNRNPRSEEHTSELQSLMRIPYAVFCLKKTNKHLKQTH